MWKTFKVVSSLGPGVRQPWVQIQVGCLLVRRHRSCSTSGSLSIPCEGKAVRGPQGRGEESLVKRFPAPPKLWLPPHQDPCFCTDHAALRERYWWSRQDSQSRGPSPATGNTDRGELPTDTPGWSPARTPSKGQAHSRHSFSSLLSKQSGSPSHCQAPGMHRPLLHMKLPGMLHSLVKLFPGSSWLSVGGKGQGGETAWPRCQGPGPPQLFLPTGSACDTSGG